MLKEEINDLHTQHNKKGIRQITTYPLVVWLKFKLSTRDLKFNTLPK